jgi:hypothetical protein
MLIVIEGADKTGKTTLAKAVAKQLGYEYVHFSAPKGPPADEYIDFLLALKKPTVCDRFHLGELVYGPMLRGKAGLTPLELVTIERVMRLRQTVVVHAVTDPRLANRRLVVSKEHEVVNQDQNLAAAGRFAEVVPRTNAGPVLRYDGSSMDNLNAVVRKLAMIDASADRGMSYTGIGTVTGRKLVFVGEQVNKNVTWRGLPFDRGASSQFLLDVFTAASIPEKAVYICNADRLTGEEAKQLRQGPTVFVALGAKASKKLTELGISHSALPHPQYVKRFHWKRQSEYVYQLREAIHAAV